MHWARNCALPTHVMQSTCQHHCRYLIISLHSHCLRLLCLYLLSSPMDRRHSPNRTLGYPGSSANSQHAPPCIDQAPFSLHRPQPPTDWAPSGSHCQFGRDLIVYGYFRAFSLPPFTLDIFSPFQIASFSPLTLPPSSLYIHHPRA